jgi:hypothetical protein
MTPYAATTLTLAARYLKVSQDWTLGQEPIRLCHYRNIALST